MDSSVGNSWGLNQPSKPMPWLVMVNGNDTGRVIPLSRGVITIGSDPEAEIRLEGDGVSPQHAWLLCEGDQVYLQDLDSETGSWCNGQRITKAILHDGDNLQFGNSWLTFMVNEPQEDRLTTMIYRYATRDRLTKLFNRVSLEDRLVRELERERRYRRGLSLIQIDIDHLQQINDHYGLKAGDAVLTAVARCLESCLRKCDLVARAGGEMFVVVLPETSRAQATKLAEKIRYWLSGLAVPWGEQVLQVTTSLGVASIDGDPHCTFDQILAEADASCRRAKKAGCNCVDAQTLLPDVAVMVNSEQPPRLSMINPSSD